MKLSLSIIVGLLAVIVFLMISHSKLQVRFRGANSVLSEKTDSIRYWKSRSGKTVAEKPAAEISAQDFQNHYSGLAAELRDIKVKVSSLKALLKASIEATGSGQVRIVRDTVRLPGGAVIASEELFVEDGYLDLKATINPGIGYTYSYTYSDSILFTLSTERKWFLGKKKLIGQVRMSNPNSRSTGQTSILIRERQKRFSISAGVSYLPFENRFAPTVTAGYTLMRF